MVAKQLSIFLENKSGRLPKMLILVFCVELYPIRIKHIKH